MGQKRRINANSMGKNDLKFYTLLFCTLLLVASSCASSKKYSSRSSKSHRSSHSRTMATKTKSRTIHSEALTQRTQIVQTAKKYIGKPYVYGGKKPSSGFDCSGFTTHVFKNNGINLTGPSHYQAKQGRKKKIDELQAGDLVFFGKKNKVSHVAIVAAVDRSRIKVIHSTSSRGVVIDDISNSSYWMERYLFGRDVLN